MSTKKSRFEGLSVVKTPPVQAVAAPTEEKREPLGTQIRSDLKIALKQASAKEQRKMYQVLEDMLEDYLKTNHPDLLK